MKIISFEEALEEAKSIDGLQPKLLLGNGFSIAFDKNIFSYKNLLENAKNKDLFKNNSRLFEVFNVSQISNFEKILRYLKEAKDIFSVYLKDTITNDALIARISNDIDQLKKIIIKALSYSHPERPASINRDQYDCCSRFLSHFDFIYTLNYDLLLYWVILKNLRSKFRDGFGYSSKSSCRLSWPSKEKANLYYLHGALHLYQKENRIIKCRWRLNESTLVSKILDNFDKDIFPLFVSEGKFSDKLNVIKNSSYLSAALIKFKQCEGALITYGVSFENDWHIMGAIAHSNISKIFIGIYNKDLSVLSKLKESVKNMQYLRGLLSVREKRSKQYLETFYYDSETANVWGYQVESNVNVLSQKRETINSL